MEIELTRVDESIAVLRGFHTNQVVNRSDRNW
jgi:hypothetical protein